VIRHSLFLPLSPIIPEIERHSYLAAMDAFKSASPSPPLGPSAYSISTDFIRHGKHARAHQQQQAAEQAQSAQNDRSRREAEETKPQERAERERDEKAAGLKDRAHHTQAAEAIVKEERAVKDKMPGIKGLERFKLLDKMGE